MGLFNWPASVNRFIRYTTARAEAINAALDQVSSAFDGLDGLFANSIRLAPGETSVPLPAASDRANKILSFDSIGNPVVSTASAGSATDLALSLSSPDGASLIGGFVSYASLRAYTGSATHVFLAGLMIFSTPQAIAGTFVRTTDTATADNGGTVIVDALGRRWARQYTGTAYYDWFEPAGDNITDDSAVFNRAHASGVTSLDFMSAKTYKLATPVQTYAKQTINNTPRALINFAGSNAYTPASDTTFNNGNFVGGRNNHAIAVPSLTGSIQRVTINNAICDTCNLARTIPAGGIAWSAIDWANKTNVAIDWVINNPQGSTVLASTAGQGFIDMEFIDGCRVNGGRAKGYYFGFIYWGGDSDYAKDGFPLSNQRKCDNIVVNGFIADNCIQAGLWGSMGVKVRFINCQAPRDNIGLGGDVGIDHEGTLDAANIGCSSSYWLHGNYATFFGTKKISCNDCTSYQRAGYPHLRVFNNGYFSDRGPAVTMWGGRYVNTDGIVAGTARIDDLNGPFKSMTIGGGIQLVDSVIIFNSNNMGSLDLDGITFELTDVSANFTVDLISVAMNSSRHERFNMSDIGISMATTTATYMQPASSLIRFNSTASNTIQSVHIADVDARTVPVRVAELGSNSGISAVFKVHDITASQLQVINAGARAMVQRFHDNHDQYGNVI